MELLLLLLRLLLVVLCICIYCNSTPLLPAIHSQAFVCPPPSSPPPAPPARSMSLLMLWRWDPWHLPAPFVFFFIIPNNQRASRVTKIVPNVCLEQSLNFCVSSSHILILNSGSGHSEQEESWVLITDDGSNGQQPSDSWGSLRIPRVFIVGRRVSLLHFTPHLSSPLHTLLMDLPVLQLAYVSLLLVCDYSIDLGFMVNRIKITAEEEEEEKSCGVWWQNNWRGDFLTRISGPSLHPHLSSLDSSNNFALASCPRVNVWSDWI